MPKEQEDFRNAVEAVLDAVIFENWLRFYFIVDKGEGEEEKLFIEIPEKGLEKIKNLYPQYLPLAQNLQNREIDFQTSQKAVCTFVLAHLDGHVFPQNMAQTVLSSAAFQLQMQLFNAWVQMHEDQLDQGFLQFDQWLDLFSQWRNGPGARELLAKLQPESHLENDQPKA